MKVGLDARILAHPQSGIATCAINLLREFRKMDDLTVCLFADKPLHPSYDMVVRNLEIDIFGQDDRKRWAQFLLPARIRRYNIDVYHAIWNNGVPFCTRVPTVVSINDLIPWRVPEVFKGWRKEVKYKFQELCAAHRAKKIITLSEHSKRDIVELLHVRPDKVRITYLGCDLKIPDGNSGVEECLRRHGIVKPYILHVGDLIQPRRNVMTLIRALGLMPQGQSDGIGIVMVGAKGSGGSLYQPIMDLARELNIDGRLIFTDHITRSDFNKILSAATALVFPSKYEGFGLPILEAMFCGIPVIASNSSSVPEVVGDAAILVAPEDANGFASAISRICSDEVLRGDLIKKGKERAKIFSWRKTAEETLGVYKEAIDLTH